MQHRLCRFVFLTCKACMIGEISSLWLNVSRGTWELSSVIENGSDECRTERNVICVCAVEKNSSLLCNHRCRLVKFCVWGSDSNSEEHRNVLWIFHIIFCLSAQGSHKSRTPNRTAVISVSGIIIFCDILNYTVFGELL